MLITIILLAFLAFSRNWVEVENDQTAYLPASCETKQALNVMSDQFTTYGTAEVMVANITYDEAEALSGRIGAVKGVQSVAFDETSGHYARASALFTVTFDRAETDDACLTSLDAVKELLTDYDLFVSTDLGNTLAETIDSEVSVIMVYVAVIIVAVLILTSRTYGEVPALLLTFIAAMVFMQFKIDPDMGICLMKSILFALLAVFIVMPALLVLFVPLIEKTEHRSWVPKISFAGRYAWASRKVVPFVFLTVSAACFFLSGKCPYAYGYSNLTTPKLNETQIAEKLIDDTFTTPNMLAFVVPAGDYEKEAALLTELESRGEIDHAVGLANTEAMDGCMLADKLTPRQFSELAGLDYEMAQVVYAAEQGDYGKLMGNIASYKVPLIDMFLFVCEQVDSGIVTLSDDQTQMLQDAEVQMNSAKAQLQGTDYDRMLIYLTLPESSDETYAFTDKILEIAEKYYPDENVYLAGESTNEYEFEKSFAVDNKVVSIVSVLVVMLVLLFTFNSAGMPVLLILVIQGCIWLNFSFPTITGKYIFFLGYLIVSSIQMGANIDYAIVIASRYQELKSKMHHRDAIVETLNFAFPTIITSGSILSICGFLIGSMTSEPVIAGIGESLGRGTVISIIMVMFALPQILLIGSGIVDKTSFSVPSITEKKSGHGKVSVNGMVRGNINGTVHGIMHATVEGDIDLNLISGSANEEQDDEED